MKKIMLLVMLLLSFALNAQKLPKGFVYLKDLVPSIKIELRYYSSHNFIGKPIHGYKSNRLIMTKEAALSLKKIQQKLLKKELSLKIFDAYRPQQAVSHFVAWAKVLNDTLMKNEYYPRVAKSNLFKNGYIASKSAHSRGSTVDLTITDAKTATELDMGSPYDFFGIESHPKYQHISDQQKKNRMLLREVMLANGFIPYENEWWHFTLKKEPFPNTYFEFSIK
jgi:D-alanyl-D-alanine dipeptidase